MNFLKLKAPAMFVAATLSLLPAAGQAASWPDSGGQTLFSGNFNNCNWTADAITETSCGFRVPGVPVGTYKIQNGVMTITTTKSQDSSRGSHHTEIEGQIDTFTKNRFAIVGEHYWYGARLKLHNWTPEDRWEIIMQWHGMADSDDATPRNPPVALMVRDGRYQLAIRADSKKVTTSTSDPNRYTREDIIDLGAAKSGEWVDWAFKIHWDPFGVDGSVVVWKNGAIAYEEYGQPNTFNDARGPVWSMGIYKYFTNTIVSSRSLSLDDVRAAKVDENGGGGGGDVTQPNIPTQPSGLSAQALSESAVEVAWQDASSDETGFTIERQEEGDTSWESVAATQRDITTYRDKGLSPATSYTYRVRAFNGVGPSAPSKAANATTLEGIELRTFGFKKRGYHKVFLSFFGSSGGAVNIVRNNTIVETTNEEVFLDEVNKRGQASYTYKVCEAAHPKSCSPNQTIVF